MPKILACDPDPETDWSILKNLGHEVFSFVDMGEALDFARENKVDIAILATPDGIDCIKYLRELSPNYKVVLLSSSPSVQEIRRALPWAPCSYLFKPMVIEEVDACLKRALLKGKTTIKIPLNI